jgi:hypothetical protein
MKKAVFAVIAASLSLGLAAQSLSGDPESVRLQREAIAQQRQAIQAEFQQNSKDCWQKFAVNACLSEARLKQRKALEPLRQQDLAVNALERQWRTEQRDIRLEGKQSENRGTP